MPKPLDADLRRLAIAAAEAFADRLIRCAGDGPVVTRARKAKADALFQLGTRSVWNGPKVETWAEGIVLDAFLLSLPVGTEEFLCASCVLLPGYCAWYCRDSPISKEDTLQEATIRLIRRFRRGFVYQSAGQFRKYVRLVAFTAFIDIGRKDRRKQIRDNRLAEPVDPVPDPCEFSEEEELSYVDRLYDGIDDAWNAIIKAEIANLHLRWFQDRYLIENPLSNQDILARDRPFSNFTTAVQVQRVSTAVSRVRDAFCTEFTAQPDSELMQNILYRWQHCSDKLWIPKDLACYLLRAADLLPANVRCGPGRGS